MMESVQFTAITTSLAFCVAAQFLQIFILEESVTIPRRHICLVALNRTTLVLHTTRGTRRDPTTPFKVPFGLTHASLSPHVCIQCDALESPD